MFSVITFRISIKLTEFVIYSILSLFVPILSKGYHTLGNLLYTMCCSQQNHLVCITLIYLLVTFFVHRLYESLPHILVNTVLIDESREMYWCSRNVLLLYSIHGMLYVSLVLCVPIWWLLLLQIWSLSHYILVKTSISMYIHDYTCIYTCQCIYMSCILVGHVMSCAMNCEL